MVRFGGTLVLVGCVLCLLAVALGVSGVEVRWMEACWQWAGCSGFAGGGLSVPHLIVPASLTLLGIGSAALALAGPHPLGGAVLRASIGMLSVGLLSFVVATNLPVPAGSNTLQSVPIVAGFGLGALTVVIGLIVTGLSLVRVPGAMRLAGSLLLAGLSLLPLAVVLATTSSDGLGGPFEAALGNLGLVMIFLGGIGVGVLAIRDEGATAIRR